MPRPPAFNPEEKIYTVAEVAALLCCNRHLVTDLFSKEHGVIDVSRLRPGRSRRLRKYSQLRIPHSAVVRVRARLEVKL
jgi:hypothetical protein